MIALDGDIHISRSVYSAARGLGVRAFKIGAPLLLQRGAGRLLRRIGQDGNALLLDLKLNDTPFAITETIRNAEALGVTHLTVWPAALEDAMRASDTMRVLLVVGLTTDPAANVTEVLALVADLLPDGLILPGGFLGPLQFERPELFENDFMLACPGVRLPEDSTHEHLIGCAPSTLSRATYAIVGRPITDAADPILAICRYKMAL